MPAKNQAERPTTRTSAPLRASRRLHAARRDRRRGAVLVEFALIAIAFYMLMAGTIEVGRMIFSGQLLQNAARVGARELALIPLPATDTFDQALADPQVKQTIYNDSLLIWDIPTGFTSQDIQTAVSGWPTINRMLYPLMIADTGPNGQAVRLRYPGAAVVSPVGNYPTIAIPQVIGRTATGVETIVWHRVVEEVTTAPTVSDPTPEGPFSMASPVAAAELHGLVALRINFPYQASTLSSYQTGPTDANRNQIVMADDAHVNPVGTFQPVLLEDHDSNVPSYAGKYGLGQLYALGATVRPYERLLTAQSIFRREIFR